MRKILSLAIPVICFVTALFPVYGQTPKEGANNLVVKEISVEGLNNIIKNRNGKYLLLNIWATWCVPCREEFPALNRINEKYKNEVELIGISVDFPDEIESKIKPFLTSLNIGFSNYVNTEKDVDKFVSNLNPEWEGAVPATFLFDTKGKQVKYFTGGKSFEEFEKVISGLIN